MDIDRRSRVIRVGVEAKTEGRNHDDGTVRIDTVL